MLTGNAVVKPLLMYGGYLRRGAGHKVIEAHADAPDGDAEQLFYSGLLVFFSESTGSAASMPP